LLSNDGEHGPKKLNHYMDILKLNGLIQRKSMVVSKQFPYPDMNKFLLKYPMSNNGSAELKKAIEFFCN
jgi:hypothetical protein